MESNLTSNNKKTPIRTLTTSSPTTPLKLAQIRTDGGTQPRAQLNQRAVEEYAQDMTYGAEFPPIEVMYDGTNYWLVDGFHRVAAATKLQRIRIDATVTQGTQRDAFKLSLGVNAEHGLRRTNEDKRRAVLRALQDEELTQLSDREIARLCKVHHDTVRRYRQQIAPSLAESASESGKRTYTTKHGTPATMDTRGISEANQARATKPTAHQRETDQPGERPSGAAPTVTDADTIIALGQLILRTLESGPKTWHELRAVVEPAGYFVGNLMTVIQRLIHQRVVIRVPDGQYALNQDRVREIRAEAAQPTPQPVAVNGANHDPNVAFALDLRRELEVAAVNVMKAIEAFQRIRSLQSLHTLSAEQIEGTQRLLTNLQAKLTAADTHADDLIDKLQIMAETGQPHAAV